MNNGLKALMIAAATIITCMVITMGFFMAKEAKQVGNAVTKELSDFRTAVEEREIVKYDGVLVSGMEIINLMKRELKEENGTLTVKVQKGKKEYVYRNLKEAEFAQDKKRAEYIEPVKEFYGIVQKDLNGVVIQICFKEEADE